MVDGCLDLINFDCQSGVALTFNIICITIVYGSYQKE